MTGVVGAVQREVAQGGELGAACATTAGWRRTVGKVTAVSTGSDTASESPITAQTNGL